MTLQETIKENMKEAMKSKESEKVTVLRGLMSAFTNELVNKGKTPQDALSDEEALAVITREAKKRKDSIQQFTDAGRPELAESEKSELVILEHYLPELMNRDEVVKIVMQKKETMGITEKSQIGQLMSAVMQDLKGKADGVVVRSVVEESFAE